MPRVLALLAVLGSLGFPASADAARCHEDQPCWTWSTMGNRKRGVVTMHGTPMVVGPCRYARLHRQGMLDPGSRPGTMRGDWFAIERGCRS